ncbi:MAG: hypothetical protein ACR2PH_04355 [Desulfobulbia bacterium]
MLNVYCLKWGSKYGPEYVNRLYASVATHYQGEFIFHCITEDPEDIHEDVVILEYIDLYLAASTVFTVEKLEIMKRHTGDKNLLLDLDILIHNDITDIVDGACTDKPTFIWTDWTPEWHKRHLIKKKLACYVNSSFVVWSGTSANFLYDHFLSSDNMSLEYDSCDKYIFYEHYWDMARPFHPLAPHAIRFFPSGKFYNYNEGKQKYQFQEKFSACLFNTSHLIGSDRRYYELDNTPNWATDLWEQYDDYF